jgi:tetratricopeptide (TPR) repeat protein
LYLENDQPSKAIALNVEQLLPVLESRIQLANSYSILGSIAFVQSRLADAETWWQRSAGICEAEKLTQEAAVSLSNLGTLKAAQGDYKGATVYFRKSVEYFTTSIGLEHPLAVKAQSNLGQSLFRLRRYQEATQWLEKAHYLARKWYGTENAITIQLCLDHAEALRKLGRKDEAKAMVTGVQRMPAAVSAALPGRSTVDVLQLGDDGLRK